MPPSFRRAYASWNNTNPQLERRLYFLEDARRYIRANFSAAHLHTFDTLLPYAYKCDFFRYLLLYHEGGYYSDARQVARKHLGTVFEPSMTWFSALDLGGRPMYNAFLASVKGHPWLRHCIELVIKRVRSYYYGSNPLEITGPIMLGSVVNVSAGRHAGGVHIGRHVNDTHIVDADWLPIVQTRFDGTHVWNDVAGSNDYTSMWISRSVYAGEDRDKLTTWDGYGKPPRAFMESLNRKSKFRGSVPRAPRNGSSPRSAGAVGGLPSRRAAPNLHRPGAPALQATAGASRSQESTQLRISATRPSADPSVQDSAAERRRHNNIHKMLDSLARRAEMAKGGRSGRANIGPASSWTV